MRARRGRREKALATALARRRRELLAALGTRPLHADIAAEARPGGGRGRAPLDAVEAGATARLLGDAAERVRCVCTL